MSWKRAIVLLVLVQHSFEAVVHENADIFQNLLQGRVEENPHPSFSNQDATLDRYDFIIVGSGAAGSVLANRLSEVPTWRILLLEVGEEPSFLTDIPALAPFFQFTNYNWGYMMERQANFCLGIEEQRMHWPRGRALGGSTVINYMIHVRGNKRDYDRWAAMGNPGWSYADVLPYFKKYEDANIRVQDSGYHSRGGYQSVEDVRYRSKSADVFIDSCQEAGMRYVDYNGIDQLGVSYIQATTKVGIRASATEAFLRPVKDRPNLTILTKARVVKILLEPHTKKAIGVLFNKNKKYHQAFVNKEVILSAGAFNSPQLLMLSGIGPKKHLHDLDIPLVKDLPVGRKMYDHITFLGLVFKVNTSITISQVRDNIDMVRYLKEYWLHRNGPLVTLGGAEAIAYIKTNASYDPEPYPDIELLFIGSGLHNDGGLVYKRMFRVSDAVYNRIWKPLEGTDAWSVFPMLLHPKSYGYMELKSKNPFHWPRFYGNYFSDRRNHDVRTFIAAIRAVQRIARMPSFQRYGTEQVTTPVPGCEHHRYDSDAYWECALRHITSTLHHQVATCKMGTKYDPEAVVDHRLRVYGIGGLRVADTSIIPIPVSAHTNGPALMVGEKAADLIKEDWGEL